MNDISISIVTYNSREDIDELLNSIYKTKNIDFSVTIVDNASHDDTCEFVRKHYPQVRVIVNQENIGFGQAHNIAIHESNSKYHIICNPDIKVETETLNNILKYMSDNNGISLLTPDVRNTDGTRQFLPQRKVRFKYMLSSILSSKIRFFKSIREEYVRLDREEKDYDIEFATGCFMIFETEFLKKIGGFDKRYFLHFEDADLSREVLYNGGRIVYTPSIRVTHGWHRDNKKSRKVFLLALNSMFKYFIKWSLRRG